MQLAFGVFNMTTHEFWSQTIVEWNARIKGKRKAQGEGDDDQFTPAMLADLQERVAEMEAPQSG